MHSTIHHQPLLGTASRRATRALFLLALGGLGGCSGGSAPSPVDLPVPGNEGSYSAADFGYIDPRDPGYHPLGTSSTAINELAEQMVLVPYDRSLSGAGTGGEETLVWIDESEPEGFGEVPGSRNLFGFDLALRGVASGNFDDDAAKEWLAAEVDNDGNRIVLHTADRGEDGSVRVERLHSFDPGPFAARDVSVELADLDGDLRDEIILVVRSSYFHISGSNGLVRVFDDPESGLGTLLLMGLPQSHTGLWAQPADVDGDGRPELAVSLARGIFPNARHHVRLYSLPTGASSMTRVHDWWEISDDSFTSGSKATVGDFDGDGRDELVTGKTFEIGDAMVILLHEWDAQGNLHAGPFATVLDVESVGNHFWAMTSFDRRGGQDELAILVHHSVAGSPWRINILTLDEIGEEWSMEPHGIVHSYNGQYPALCAGDLNADGTEELQWGLLRGYNTEAHLWRGYLSNEPGLGWQNFPARTFFGNQMRSRPPVLVPGDWDADGLIVEYTGRKSFQMMRPIPLAVLSAPPIRSGISQNYGDTQTRFETGTSTSQTWGVVTGTTVTAAVGAEVDVFGLFQVGARTTFEETLQKTETETTQVSFISGYSGSAAADTIVFQGTLQQAYEYVVLEAPDPSAIGQFLTVNVPVDSQTYNWTLDYFNSQMPEPDRIAAEVLGHTPGRIETYPTFHELDARIGDSVHWRSPSQQDVGQGAGSNDQEIAFLDESTSEEQRTVTVAEEAGVAVGVEASGGQASTTGYSYSVTFSETTRFTTTVGAIANPLDYERWRYNWGMAVETFARTADAANNPTGYVAGERPFQCIHYWVERSGNAY